MGYIKYCIKYIKENAKPFFKQTGILIIVDFILTILLVEFINFIATIPVTTFSVFLSFLILMLFAIACVAFNLSYIAYRQKHN